MDGFIGKRFCSNGSNQGHLLDGISGAHAIPTAKSRRGDRSALSPRRVMYSRIIIDKRNIHRSFACQIGKVRVEWGVHGGCMWSLVCLLFFTDFL